MARALGPLEKIERAALQPPAAGKPGRLELGALGLAVPGSIDLAISDAVAGRGDAGLCPAARPAGGLIMGVERFGRGAGYVLAVLERHSLR